MLRFATSLVAPPACSVCDSPVDWRERACAACSRELARLGPVRAAIGGMEVVSAVRYERVARLLVARLKFGSRLALAHVAADAMVAAWRPARTGALVPVPPSAARERARGFDTASLLARLVAARTGSPVAECLERQDNRRQFGRRRAERLAEPPAIAATRRAARLAGCPVWIVDDVTTTGATLLACRQALRRAGTTDVRALTFARAC